MSRLDILSSYLGARWRAATLHGSRLRAWQESRATALVRDVRQASPFHRALWSDCADTAWRSFPMVNKQLMMDNFDRFTTRGVTRDEAMSIALDAERRRDFSARVHDCTVGLSSGTSGHRGLFLVSPEEQTRWAGTILARAIPDLRPGHRVAFFLRANSRLYERTSSLVAFRFFDLMLPIDAMIAQLQVFRPKLIVGPPSLLGQLADAREHGRLQVSPTRVISVAEVLEPQDRLRLERVFQCNIGEVYQCTEGLIAVSCKYGSLHVQEDVIVMQTEAIDPADVTRVTPVVTDLWRRTQPIVRYQLGDILRINAAPCACGSSWQCIAAIEGRQDDLCWFPLSDDVLRPVFPDAIRRMMLLADDRILEYRAEQPAPGELVAFIAVRNSAEFANVARALHETVTEALAAYGCRATALSVHEGIPSLAPGVKRRRVICNWKSSPRASLAGV